MAVGTIPKRSFLVGAGATAATLALSVDAWAAGPTYEELDAKGKAIRYFAPIKGQRCRAGAAAIWIDAPIAKARRLTQSYGRYRKYVPLFTQSRLLQKNKDGSSDVYLEIPVLHGAAKIWAVLRFDPAEARNEGEGSPERIVAHYVKGNVNDLIAMWTLVPVTPKRCIIHLDLMVDPDLPLPNSLLESSLAYAADKGVTAIRDYAEGRRKL